MNILQLHAKVFLDLLGADADLEVLHGQVPTGQKPPYLLVYFAFRTPSGTDEPQKVSKEATSDLLTTTVYCHSVAETPNTALTVAGRGRVALLGVFPTVAGRICYPIEHVDGPPMQRDEATLANVFDQVDAYQFTSQPG
ncbi:MAG: hypothetical protein ABW046_20595 [Actinoplanes sp.]